MAGYFNAGQDCTAATRVLAGPGIHDDFVAALTEQARNTRTGAPDDEDVLYGPLNNANQLARVGGFVDRLPDHAALDDRRRPGRRPRLLLRPDRRLRAAARPTRSSRTRCSARSSPCSASPTRTRRCAGPTASSTAWPSSVWTRDHGRAMRMTRRLDFGCVWVNTHIPLVAEMPHGGFKHSGHGKDLSVYGLEDYTRIKHVMHNIEG